MYKKINRLLERYFNVRISRAQGTEFISGKQSVGGDNLIIEFMGASGVGKTTLRDYYLKHHTTNFQRAVITEQDLSKYIIEPEEEPSDKNEFYNHLYLLKLKRMSQSNDTFFKSNRRVNLFYKYLHNDYLIRNFLNDKTALLDQHVFKFFTEDFNRLGESSVKMGFLKNRVIIYCSASPEQIVAYIQKRSKSGSTRSVHFNKQKGELLKETKEHLEARKNDIDKLEKSGAQIIRVDTELELAENTKVIDNFLSSYLKNF